MRGSRSPGENQQKCQVRRCWLPRDDDDDGEIGISMTPGNKFDLHAEASLDPFPRGFPLWACPPSVGIGGFGGFGGVGDGTVE